MVCLAFFILASSRPVQCPLFDALGLQQSGLAEDFQMPAGRGLADPELLCDQHTTNAILDQIPIHLRPEMLPRVLQAIEDLQPAFVRQGPQNEFRLRQLPK